MTFHTLYFLFQTLKTLFSKLQTSTSTPNPQTRNLNLKLETRNLKPQTPNPQTRTLKLRNIKPSNLQTFKPSSKFWSHKVGFSCCYLSFAIIHTYNYFVSCFFNFCSIGSDYKFSMQLTISINK